MKVMRNGFMVAMVVLMLPLTALAGTFSDVTAGHTNQAAIEYLVYTGTLQGYSDGTFKPENTINRAELMKVLVAGQGIDPDADTYNNCFPDVTTDWYAPYVCYAHEQGWVDGYPSGLFDPARTVNKVEAAKMIINGLGLGSLVPDEVTDKLYNDADSSAWYAPYLYVVKNLNLDGAGTKFYPDNGMDRGRAAEYLFRVEVITISGAAYEDGDGEEFLTLLGLSDLLDEEETTEDEQEDVTDTTNDATYEDSVDIDLAITLQSYGDLTISNWGDTADYTGYYLEDDYSVFYYEFSGVFTAGDSFDVDASELLNYDTTDNEMNLYDANGDWVSSWSSY